jgi:ankyrin repeat protein
LASLAGGMNIDSQDSVSGMTLLMRAVSFGQEHIVRLLLNHGANVNIKDNTGSTPLIVACEQVKNVKVLLYLYGSLIPMVIILFVVGI